MLNHQVTSLKWFCNLPRILCKRKESIMAVWTTVYVIPFPWKLWVRFCLPDWCKIMHFTAVTILFFKKHNVALLMVETCDVHETVSRASKRKRTVQQSSVSLLRGPVPCWVAQSAPHSSLSPARQRTMVSSCGLSSLRPLKKYQLQKLFCAKTFKKLISFCLPPLCLPCKPHDTACPLISPVPSSLWERAAAEIETLRHEPSWCQLIQTHQLLWSHTNLQQLRVQSYWHSANYINF